MKRAHSANTLFFSKCLSKPSDYIAFTDDNELSKSYSDNCDASSENTNNTYYSNAVTIFDEQKTQCKSFKNNQYIHEKNKQYFEVHKNQLKLYVKVGQSIVESLTYSEIFNRLETMFERYEDLVVIEELRTKPGIVFLN